VVWLVVDTICGFPLAQVGNLDFLSGLMDTVAGISEATDLIERAAVLWTFGDTECIAVWPGRILCLFYSRKIS
jgi:hypothetical protein